MAKLDLSVLVELTSSEELESVVVILKESNIIEDFEIDTSDIANAIGVFMKAVESVPIADEDSIPEEVTDLYNRFSDKLKAILEEKKKGASNAMATKKEETKKPVAKAAAKPAAKPAAKQTAKEPVKKAAAKPASTGEFREGSSAQAILECVKKAGKKGISKEQVIEELDGKIVTNSVPGRVRKILLSSIQKGLVTKNEAGLYFPV